MLAPHQHNHQQQYNSTYPNGIHSHTLISVCPYIRRNKKPYFICVRHQSAAKHSGRCLLVACLTGLRVLFTTHKQARRPFVSEHFILCVRTALALLTSFIMRFRTGDEIWQSTIRWLAANVCPPHPSRQSRKMCPPICDYRKGNRNANFVK